MEQQLTIEQQKAIALARARSRLSNSQTQEQTPKEPTTAEKIAGFPLTRFALGAASPFLGAAQVVSEALGDTTGTETLKQLEGMKKRGSEYWGQKLSEHPAIQRAVMSSPVGPAFLLSQSAGDTDVAGIAGSVMSPAVLGAMKIPAATSVLGRSAQGAAIGGAFGLSSPVETGEDYWGSKGKQVAGGATLGAVIPPSIDIASGLWNVGKKLLDPFLPGGAQRAAAKILSEATGPKRAAVEAELGRNQVLVPGSAPTAAEAAARAGSPEMSALQRVAEARNPSAFNDIAKQQEAARLAAIQSFGKDKAALEAAEKARSAIADPLYKAAYSKAISVDPALAKIASNPYFKNAVPTATDLAKANNVNPKLKLTQFLHYVKIGIDKQIAKTGEGALSAAEKRAALDAKEQLIDWLKNKNSTYDLARSEFAKASKPINVMQVGQQLEDALVKPIGEGERLGVFANAVRNAPATIKKATGQKVYDELGDILSPQDIQSVKGVLADLARKAEMERMVSKGGARVSEVISPFGLPAVGPFQQEYTTVRAVLARITSKVNDKTINELAEAMQVPSRALRLLQSAPTQQRQKLINAIMAQKFGRGAIAAGAELSGESSQ